MKFFCEYCGNRIDAEKEDKCPNCGASYKKNKSFIKLEEERKKQIQIDQENKEKVIKHAFNIFKFSGIMSIIPIVIFFIVFITIIVLGISVGTKQSNKKDQIIEQNNVSEFIESITDQNSKEESIVASFDEFAETKNYKVKVNKYEVVKDNFKKAEEGYEIVKFHLLVENLTNYDIDTEDVNCVVDGIAQNNYYYSGHSDLPFDVSKGLTVKGTATFIVPKDAKSYEIKYGDYVTIKIEK